MVDEALKRPLVGVGVVVFRGDEVLIVRRGRPPFQGQWSIPGGKLEFGERLEGAALREVQEETGVDARLIGLIGVFEAPPGVAADLRAHMVMVDYAAEWVAGEPQAGDDAAAAEFVPIGEARGRLSWDETRRAVDMALKLRTGAGSAG